MTDNPDLAEAIRLLRSLTLQWPSADRSVYWLANDEAAKMAELLAKYPERPKLLPCPFCGGEAEWHGGTEAGSVRCRVCEAAGPHKDTARAIAAWNRRATPVGGPLSGGKTE